MAESWNDPAVAKQPPGWWFVCEHPERPFEPGLSFVHGPRDRCRGCLIALEAAARRGDALATTIGPSIPGPSIADLIEQMREAIDA